MNLTDLLPLEEWARIEEEICDQSGLDASVFGPDGMKITKFKKWANSLCPVIKANEKGLSFICAVANQTMTKEVSQTKEPLVSGCDAGLLRIAVPICVDGEFLGTVGACGRILEDNEVESFLINKTTGIDEDEVRRLSTDIQPVSAGEAQTIADNIDKRIKGVVENFQKESRKQ